MSMVLSYNRKRKLVTLLEIKGYLVKHRCVRGASRTYCLGVIGKEERSEERRVGKECLL